MARVMSMGANLAQNGNKTCYAILIQYDSFSEICKIRCASKNGEHTTSRKMNAL